ncbi:MAG: hypothetical protein E6J34_08035 [Chloroflexi bacterium]|nr:MAG: hypothetical protein E6J34_08035 [Chloroflexota bacterium]
MEAWRISLKSWWGAVVAVFPVFMITRLIFLLLTYFGGILFSIPNDWPGSLSLHDVIYTWNRWDAAHFATIAAQGYVSQDDTSLFPLFPALEHVLSVMTHKDILLCGMLISNVAFLGTLLVFYRLVETEFDEVTARRAVVYLAIFPTALFFFAGYQESLFLFFMLLSFYAMRQGLWWLAGLFGGLATLTNFIGLFLLIIFLCEYARQSFPLFVDEWRKKRRGYAFTRLLSFFAVFLIPLGLGVYAYALSQRFSDPLAFIHTPLLARGTISPPWVAPLLALKFIMTAPRFGFFTLHNIIDLGALLLFLILIALALLGPERLAGNQWTFILFGFMVLCYALLFPVAPGTAAGLPYDPLLLMQRLVLEVFVGFIILARLGRRPWFHHSYLILSSAFLAFFTLQFITGHWAV